MSQPRDITSNLSKDFERAVQVSASPPGSFPQINHSMSPSSPRDTDRFLARRNTATQPVKVLKPFNTEDIKILLLENINQTAIDILVKQGYQVEFLKTSLPEDELIAKIRDVHAIGIRSKTKLTAKVLREARNLYAIGCFCIGTNQVDLEYAAEHGIPVFNSPFSNSRSVAELVISEIIALARQMPERSMEMHQGIWNKVSQRCWEIRGKTLGIIGYGHIGSQLSVLAEALGMNVIYNDVVPLMGLGNSRQVELDELLREADFVTLHVPETDETKGMMNAAKLAKLKKGAYLINASRGTIVDIPELVKSLESGQVAGCALDVYPNEPAKNGPFFNASLNTFQPELVKQKNVILTPHIGGSTEEAQSAIGVEVGQALLRFINEGITIGAVNFPEVTLRSMAPEEENHVRVIYVHKNVPGVLRTVNAILSEHNIEKQFSDSRGEIAYLLADICDVDHADIKELYQQLVKTPFNIVTRLLY